MARRRKANKLAKSHIFQKESKIVELVNTNIPEDKISAEQQSKVAN
ncbi:transposase, IS4 family [Wolbachia endosymbiont of Armadillidium vulgare str. wVulC]|nr:transposase, IS4 family [Wolbachia endosymbiont of Armadillidium vulgare str. wVulC]OJH30885.1 hypothetical protein Wxf_00251 [Wolbachia endosymbiont of Armadillidium vulgare]